VAKSSSAVVAKSVFCSAHHLAMDAISNTSKIESTTWAIIGALRGTFKGPDGEALPNAQVAQMIIDSTEQLKDIANSGQMTPEQFQHVCYQNARYSHLPCLTQCLFQLKEWAEKHIVNPQNSNSCQPEHTSVTPEAQKQT
jgi:hypothetical protein